MPSVICGGCQQDIFECRCTTRYYWKDGKRYPLPSAEEATHGPTDDTASALEYLSDSIRFIMTEIAQIKKRLDANGIYA